MALGTQMPAESMSKPQNIAIFQAITFKDLNTSFLYNKTPMASINTHILKISSQFDINTLFHFNQPTRNLTQMGNWNF